jgi:hypothetical protein
VVLIGYRYEDFDDNAVRVLANAVGRSHLLGESPSFHRGDANGDGRMDISDGIFILGYLFLGDEAPLCIEAANTNDDRWLNMADAIHLFGYLFLQGEVPPAPGPPGQECGPDPPGSVENLGCDSYDGC